MKELHNHIFSNTTCISKEIMLRYINKQLSKEELYEVEKHMLDCELCSDAYEGMQYAQNSSVLFAIDHQIDQRVGGGNFKAPVMRNLMVAASILVIVFGTYFTFNYFNNTVNNEKELAINEEFQVVQPEESPVEEILNDEEITANISQGNSLAKLDDKKLKDVNERASNAEYRTERNLYQSTVAEQSPEIMDVISYDAEEQTEAIEEELIVTANITRAKAKGENSKLLDSNNEPKAENRREDDFDNTVQAEPVNSGNNIGFASNDLEADKSGEALKKEIKKTTTTKNKGSKKEKFKANAQAPAYYETAPLEDESKDSRDRNQQKILVIDSYKVVDYTEEYQKEYDLKNANTIDTKSVSAGFEGKTDKDEAEKEVDELTVEITYKETLEKAIKLYKNANYIQAIEQFDVILKEHPDEVNGLFYGGLSNYHLQRYNNANQKLDLVLKNKEVSFNEEAEWYKALTLIELKQVETAKKLLKKIIASNGFYKTKAQEKLKELE